MLGPCVQIRQRQAIPGDIGHIAHQLAVAIYQQRETPNEIVFGSLQLGGCGAFVHKPGQHLTHQLQGLLRLVRAGLQTNGECSGMEARRKVAGHAVRQAPLLAHFLTQARDKTTAPQDMVAHCEGKKVGVIALETGLAHQHLRLSRCKRYALLLRAMQGLDFGHRRQCRASARRTDTFSSKPGHQRREQLGHQRIGLCPVYRAHHAHLRVAGPNGLGVHSLHVLHADARQCVCRSFPAIRVFAIHATGKGPSGHRGGAGIRLLQAGNHLGPVPQPRGFGKRGLAQLSARQGHGPGQQVRVGERTQRKSHAVCRSPATKRGPQIGPGVVQPVLVQRCFLAIRTHPVRGGRGHGAGQARLVGRVTAGTGVKIHLHVHHGNGRAVHQVHPHPGRLRPVFNGQGRPCRIYKK